MVEELLTNWFNQVKTRIAENDLLYHRLGFLYYLLLEQSLWRAKIDTALIQGSIEKILPIHEISSSTSNRFRASTVNLFINQQDPDWNYKALSQYFRPINLRFEASFEFEPALVAAKMSIKFLKIIIPNLWKRFSPDQIAPHLARCLFSNVEPSDFKVLIQKAPLLWKQIYSCPYQGNAHFPVLHLPLFTHQSLWQRRHTRASPCNLRPVSQIILNTPEQLESLIRQSKELAQNPKCVTTTSDGTVRFNCQACQIHLTKYYLKGRIRALAVETLPLPQFSPKLKPYLAIEAPNIFSNANSFEEDDLVKQLCIMDKETLGEMLLLVKNVILILNTAASIFQSWQISYGLYTRDVNDSIPN